VEKMLGEKPQWESFRTGSLEGQVVDRKGFQKAFERGQMRQSTV